MQLAAVVSGPFEEFFAVFGVRPVAMDEGAEAAGQSLRLAAGTLVRTGAEGGETRSHDVERPGKRTGQEGVSDEQVEHLPGVDFHAVFSVVRFEGVVGAQECRPVGICVLLDFRFGVELEEQEGNQELRAFDDAPKLHEHPSLVAVHGRLRDARKGVYLGRGLRIEALGETLQIP